MLFSQVVASPCGHPVLTLPTGWQPGRLYSFQGAMLRHVCLFTSCRLMVCSDCGVFSPMCLSRSRGLIKCPCMSCHFMQVLRSAWYTLGWQWDCTSHRMQCCSADRSPSVPYTSYNPCGISLHGLVCCVVGNASLLVGGKAGGNLSQSACPTHAYR